MDLELPAVEVQFTAVRNGLHTLHESSPAVEPEMPPVSPVSDRILRLEYNQVNNNEDLLNAFTGEDVGADEEWRTRMAQSLQHDLDEVERHCSRRHTASCELLPPVSVEAELDAVSDPL